MQESEAIAAKSAPMRHIIFLAKRIYGICGGGIRESSMDSIGGGGGNRTLE